MTIVEIGRTKKKNYFKIILVVLFGLVYTYIIRKFIYERKLTNEMK